MKFYRVIFNEAYRFLTTKNDEDIRFLRRKLSTATPVNADDKVIELIDSKDSSSDTKELADFPGVYSGGILATKQVKSEVEANLSGCGEWVPMVFNGEWLYYFNVINTKDVLDLDKSEVSMFDGYITDIRKYKFKTTEDCLPMLFKMAKHITHPPVATQDFVDMIKKGGFTGLIFEELK